MHIVAALAGPGAVRAWLELSDLLEDRPGWRFELSSDGSPQWTFGDDERLWVTAETNDDGTWRRFVVWRLGLEEDDAAWWHLDTRQRLRGELSRQEAGRWRPWTRSGGTGVWDPRYDQAGYG